MNEEESMIKWSEYVAGQRSNIIRDVFNEANHDDDLPTAKNDGDYWYAWYPDGMALLREDHPDYVPYPETDINVYWDHVNVGVKITAYYINDDGQTDTNTYIDLI
jgi:hypothetical protein